jgi:hypothetical protein
MDMSFGRWKVKTLCRAGSQTTVARQLAKYKMNSEGSTGDHVGQEWNDNGLYRESRTKIKN